MLPNGFLGAFQAAEKDGIFLPTLFQDVIFTNNVQHNSRNFTQKDSKTEFSILQDMDWEDFSLW